MQKSLDQMNVRVHRAVSAIDGVSGMAILRAIAAGEREFREQAQIFRNHALLYDDRWHSLIEIYASNGNFPTNTPIFPQHFLDAVQLEIQARTSGHK